MDKAFYALLLYCAARELWFHYQTHKLLNKAMSQTYYDYRLAETLKPAKVDPPKMREEDSLPEDFSHVLG